MMNSNNLFKPFVVFTGFLSLAYFGISPANAGTREKTDVIYLKNGDRITCEIKKLEDGQLEVKAAYGKSTFILNWAEVEKIDSPQHFVVEVQSGTYFEGLIRTDAKQHDNLEVRTGATAISLPQREVVRVGQFGRGILDRIKFGIDYGFTYARSNKQTQSTLHSNIEYRSDKVMLGGEIDSLFASQSEAPDTNRDEGSAFYYRRLQGSRWYGGWFGNFLTNNQQDLSVRLTTGVGIVRNVFTTYRNDLLVQGGIVYSHEKFSVPEPDGARYNNAEGAIGFRYSMFRFDTAQFITKAIIYPSLTQSGRVRSAADVSLYLKVIGDFYTRFSLYSNFDSRPPNNTSKHDYGVSTSIGWTY